MKKQSLKTPYGVRDGKILHISEVERGLQCKCQCINCGSPLVARKGSLKIHHFSHHSDEQSCNFETVVHLLAKELLMTRIEKAIKEDNPLFIRWHCRECKENHKVNLISKTSSLKKEFQVENFRPDITLFNSQGNPYIGIEMIYSHQPEENVMERYKRNKMTLIEISLEQGFAKLESIKNESPLEVSHVDYCMTPRCQCGGLLYERGIYIANTSCWKCGQEIKAAYMHAGFGPESPEYFKSQEIYYARKMGVKLERSYSKTLERSYMANVCPHCKHILGSHYISRLIEEDHYDPKSILRFCEKCGKVVTNDKVPASAGWVSREAEASHALSHT
ncbi:MAG: hypothetical protein LBM92_04010 [Opitutaceae bacterium]|jgi:hypothetical protein|nr:hypothetical protein [Opitutaceae bacterium]